MALRAVQERTQRILRDLLGAVARHRQQVASASGEVQRRSRDVVGEYDAVRRAAADLGELAYLYEEDDDKQGLAELEAQTEQLAERAARLREDVCFFDSPRCGAFVTVATGAGGLDASDWSRMLVDMYTGWATRRGHRATILEEAFAQGSQAEGLKSATLQIDGENAYSWLRIDGGVHRLVRLSPYDKDRRHTSFATVRVHPNLPAEDVAVANADLRIETMSASKPGGQRVNRGMSAVRVTHIPTGLQVKIQDHRSQHRNRELALQILRAKLWTQREDEEQQKRAQELRSGPSASFGGAHIRSYVLHPYRKVTDHRTDLSTSDAVGVLDGNETLDDLLLAEHVRRLPLPPRGT